MLAFLAGYLIYLNQIIDSRFQGGAWALPSRVYARSLEIYPGLELSREQLVYELQLASYSRADKPAPGRRVSPAGRIAGIPQPALPVQRSEGRAAAVVQVFFDAGKVIALVDSRVGIDLPVFRLPPLILGSYYPQSGEDRLLLSEDEVPEQSGCHTGCCRRPGFL